MFKIAADARPTIYSIGYICFSYLLISLLPFFSESAFNATGVAFALDALCILTVLAWLVCWAIFASPRWFHFLLLPAFLCLPIELYLQVYFKQGITAHHIGIIAETSPAEAKEFLGQNFWLLILALSLSFAWWYSIYYLIKNKCLLRWQHPSRRYFIGMIVITFCLYLYAEQIGLQSTLPAASAQHKTKPKTTFARIQLPLGTQSDILIWIVDGINQLLVRLPKLPRWLEMPYTQQQFMQTWPYGIILRGIDFLNERSYLARLSEKNRDFKFSAYQLPGENSAQTILLVIGESSRYDRWSLHGYERETTPNLKLESNLVSFKNMLSGVTATRLSVPIIVSRKPATQGLKAGFSEKSFITAFKEAGFKTFWLSNQMSFGEFDTPTSVFANEAEIRQFLNLGGFTNSSNLDQVLLAPLENALQDRAERKLIVLHTLGNHWNYSHRHSAEFEQWKPSLSGIKNPDYTDLKNKQAINNSYDNSILYTDWILSEMIALLKQKNQRSALLYVADHGQVLYDNQCKLAFHGHNTDYEFHVPSFMWYSDAYRLSHEAKITQLLAHQNSKLSTENIFHSVLDMADIRYPNDTLEWSFLSPSFKRHIRYVDSHGWINYDNASFNGACREVVPKIVTKKSLSKAQKSSL